MWRKTREDSKTKKKTYLHTGKDGGSKRRTWGGRETIDKTGEETEVEGVLRGSAVLG